MDGESRRSVDGRISPRRKKKRDIQRELDSSMDSRQRDSVSPNGRQLPPLYPTSRASTTSDTLRDEEPAVKPPRKKKNAAVSQETLVEAEDTPRLSTDGSQAIKKKKKKKVRSMEHDPNSIGLATELYDLKDDIVSKPSETEPNATSVTVGAMKSQPTNKLFIEQKSGFKVAEKSKVAQRRADEELRRTALANQALSSGEHSTIELALWSHVALERGYQFIRGILAGISLWQIISTYMLLNHSNEDFLSNYYMLASPLQCLYFFLFAVCLVSVLDRYDLARPTYICMLQSVTCQAGTVAVLFYFIGFVFSLATAFMDERISLYNVNPTLWNDTTTTSDVLYQWSILNIIRGLMAMLAFLLVCCSKPADRLRETLQLADRNILDLEETQDDNSNSKYDTSKEYTA